MKTILYTYLAVMTSWAITGVGTTPEIRTVEYGWDFVVTCFWVNAIPMLLGYLVGKYEE